MFHKEIIDDFLMTIQNTKKMPWWNAYNFCVLNHCTANVENIVSS